MKVKIGKHFNTIDELFDRIKEVLEAIEDIEECEESFGFLSEAMYRKDDIIYGAEDIGMTIAEGLHDADSTYPLHPKVARLLIEIYEDAILDGNADAMCNLGALYYTGRAGEQDYEKAENYYKMADQEGNTQATENLGYIYYYGRTGERDYEKAFKYFTKGALDNRICSLYKVGDFYKNGYYVDKDPKQAFSIYNRCASLMEDEDIHLYGADVYLRMGDCLYDGIGVERDMIGALHFLGLAETLLYNRLMNGDFYMERSLKHVLKTEDEIRKIIREEMLPDLSWTDYNE